MVALASSVVAAAANPACLYDASTYRSFVDTSQAMAYKDVVLLFYAYSGYLAPTNPITARVRECADYDSDAELSYGDVVKVTYAYLGYIGVHPRLPSYTDNPATLFNQSAYTLTNYGVSLWRATLPLSYSAAGSPPAGALGTLEEFADAPISFPYSVYGTYFLGKDPILVPPGYALDAWRPIGRQFVESNVRAYESLPQRPASIALTTRAALAKEDFYWCDTSVGCAERPDVLVDVDNGFGFRHPGGRGFKFAGHLVSRASYADYELRFTFAYKDRALRGTTFFVHDTPSGGLFLNTKWGPETPPRHYVTAAKTQFQLNTGGVGGVLRPAEDFRSNPPSYAGDAPSTYAPMHFVLRVSGATLSASVNGVPLLWGGEAVLELPNPETSGAIGFEDENYDFDVTDMSIAPLPAAAP